MKPTNFSVFVISFVFSLFAVIFFSGCRAVRPDYSLFKTDREERIDELWRQGYGYNNPNVDRIGNDQVPLNFDGQPSTYESAAKGLGERAVGNVLAGVLFEGVPALFRGIPDKLRR